MTTALQCPQCGGDNPLPSGARLVTCQFCDAALFVDRSGLVSHYRLPRLLDRGKAEGALRRWMAGNQTVKDLDSKATDVTLTPLLFPVWMFRLRTSEGEVVHAEPAAATPEPALADLRVPAGQLQPWRAGAAEEGVETTAATVPLETARGWHDQQAGAGGPGRMVETALVHVPLWRATYVFGGRTYTALVEASTGDVFASIFPEKAEAPYYLVAALGLILFTVEGLAIFNVFWKLVAYAVTAVPLVGLAWWVARKV